MIQKAKVILEIVYDDDQCDHPREWDWCELTGEIAICTASATLEATDEDREQMS